MTPEAILFMVLMLGIVWGGFAYTLYFGTRRERLKREQSDLKETPSEE